MRRNQNLYDFFFFIVAKLVAGAAIDKGIRGGGKILIKVYVY